MFTELIKEDIQRVSDHVGIFDTVKFIDDESKFHLSQYSGDLLLAYFDGDYRQEQAQTQTFLVSTITYLVMVGGKYLTEPMILNIMSASQFNFVVETNSKEIFESVYPTQSFSEDVNLLRFRSTIKTPFIKPNCLLEMCDPCNELEVAHYD